MTMKLAEKKRIVAELAEELDAAGAIYLTDFSGLDVDAQTELRARLREEGVGYRVAKNTLMRFALEDLDLPEELSEHLRGPTGVVLGGEDPVTPAKVVQEFAEDHEDRPTVKVGVVERRTLSPDEVRQLSELPTREELLASILGSLSAPVAGIHGVLNGLLRDLAYMVGQIGEKRGDESGAGENGAAG